jgi:hypothetical protein
MAAVPTCGYGGYSADGGYSGVGSYGAGDGGLHGYLGQGGGMGSPALHGGYGSLVQDDAYGSPVRPHRLVSGSSVVDGGTLTFPLGWLPFSSACGSAEVPLSSEQSSGAGRSGVQCSPSEGRRPGPASAPLGLAAHKRALRKEVHV